MSSKTIGLYVHIPFCLHKCNYCDFVSFAGLDAEARENYIDALIREIRSYGDTVTETVDTVYFGGGTPSLLTAAQFARINSALHAAFRISPSAEYTVEVNPAALSEETLSAFIAGGVNRVSIGLQSVIEKEQRTLGRVHDLKDFLSTYRAVRDAGIRNVNVDLMYAIPGQTAESFAESIEFLLSIAPEHISAYSLIVEDGTPFGDMRNNLDLPDEDTELDMAHLLWDKLRKSGYLHYEISNFSKPGLQSKHNTRYWRCGEYLGFGVSAYSYYGKKRFGNSRNMTEYLSDSYENFREITPLTKEDEAYEFAMLGLRLSEGFSLSEYREKFGTDFLSERRGKISEYEKGGLLRLNGDRLFLTEEGFYVSNSILSEIL